MPLLDTAIAFALTMLGIATTVTVILGALRRMAAVRSKVMGRMLNAYLHAELKPLAEAALTRTLGAAEGAKAKAELDAAWAGLPALAPTIGLIGSSHLPLPEDTKAGLTSLAGFLRAVQDKKSASIERDDLIQSLRAIPELAVLESRLGDEAEAFWSAAARRYDALGAQISESFRARSNLWSTVIATVLAVALNIDAIQLLRVYYQDSLTSGAVVARLDGLMQGFEAVQAIAPAVPQGPDTQEQVMALLAEVKGSVDGLAGQDFPIGHGMFPYCHAEASAGVGLPGGDPRCGADVERWSLAGGLTYMLWVAGLVLTGMLAGLGGPFWYDTLRGLAAASQALKGGGTPGGGAAQTQPPQASQPALPG